MQEHIRRAHPEHYISKLPATEESFLMMVNTPPSERPPPPPQPPRTSAGPSDPASNIDPIFGEDFGSARSSDEFRRGSLIPAANAAAALAQLHSHRSEFAWDPEQDLLSENDSKPNRLRAHFAPTEFDQQTFFDDAYPVPNAYLGRELHPSALARSPPGRSSTLPPGMRAVKPNRPRKPSVTQNALKPKHERTKSKEHKRRMSYDRKAQSAEPSLAAAKLGSRWEDLIDAAASATEADSRDLTPVPASPHMFSRSSLPPGVASQFQLYQASPLQNSLTPPPPDHADLHPFPSVESSIESAQSGQNFHIASQGLSDSSPTFQHQVQIYCAGCHKLSLLKSSYACTECICGICQECVDVLVGEQARGRIARCPRCGSIGGKFKPFQLDIR
ncbi:hypothetical protein H2201_008331 [Coniosporium apollinis]|uniref:RING zinc finger-like domain-containing protein n=1 Tax=Coniosporium apollinis TaxID=61459 RepID=A0ABQ9NH89_9PEZI|nr:hypothetical protein H2201_008331 [Coniosporium apollinis]